MRVARWRAEPTADAVFGLSFWRQLPTHVRMTATPGDRVLHVDNALHASLNVRRDLLEIQICDEDAPDDRRWLSILVDRVSGAVVSGTAQDANAAWRKAREALQ